MKTNIVCECVCVSVERKTNSEMKDEKNNNDNNKFFIQTVQSLVGDSSIV